MNRAVFLAIARGQRRPVCEGKMSFSDEVMMGTSCTGPTSPVGKDAGPGAGAAEPEGRTSPSKYDGERKDGKTHGKGVGTLDGGHKYDGEFKNGKRHGRGVMTFDDGGGYVCTPFPCALPSLNLPSYLFPLE